MRQRSTRVNRKGQGLSFELIDIHGAILAICTVGVQ